MSNNLKTQLLVASAMFAASSFSASAQTLTYPAAELHGVGASSVQITITRELNCFGPVGTVAVPSTGNPRGVNDGTTATVAQGASVDTTNPFTCGVDGIQSQIGGKYIATGSGDGKAAFRNKTVTAVLSGSKWPTAFGANASVWGNAHYALSDAPLTASDLATYQTNNPGNAAIQVPLYVIPVALAYNPVYGRKTVGTTTTDYTFNVQQPVSVNAGAGAAVAGGLRLTKQVYCSIFNGYITNWNDARITALNLPKKGAAVSLKDAADDAARWTSEGVPIRLIGRFDGSGTTDIFTRHLAAACGGGIMGTGRPNAFLNAAEALPWDPTSATLSDNRGASNRYFLNSPATNFAGTVNTLSGAVWNTSGAALFAGTEAAGKFAVARGSSGIYNAMIVGGADKTSTVDATVKLNGKLGYISADFVAPAPNQLLHSAAVEVGVSSQTKKPLFAMPTAATAVAAFGTKILPPESDKGGKYVKGGAFSRSNPLDWYEALYAGDSTLANPPVGYAITGTTQLLTGTCFADPAVRNALVTYLTAKVGRLTFDEKLKNKKLLASFFTSSAAKTMSISGQAGLAPLPKAWNTAIFETFLTRSKMKSGTDLLVDRNLYIQAGIPTVKGIATIDQATGLKRPTVKTTLVAADLPTAVSRVVKGKTIFNEAAPNSTCTAGSGL